MISRHAHRQSVSPDIISSPTEEDENIVYLHISDAGRSDERESLSLAATTLVPR